LLRLLGALFEAHETDSALSLYEMLRTTQEAHQRLKTRRGEGSGADARDDADGFDDGDDGANADLADVTFVSRQVAFAVLETVTLPPACMRSPRRPPLPLPTGGPRSVGGRHGRSQGRHGARAAGSRALPEPGRRRGRARGGHRAHV
jgi:hypothetical protein